MQECRTWWLDQCKLITEWDFFSAVVLAALLRLMCMYAGYVRASPVHDTNSSMSTDLKVDAGQKLLLWCTNVDIYTCVQC